MRQNPNSEYGQEPYNEDFLNDPIFDELNQPGTGSGQDYYQSYDQVYGQAYGDGYGDADYSGGYGDPQGGYTPEPQQKVRRWTKGAVITLILFYLLLLAGSFLFYKFSEKNLRKLDTELAAFEQAQPVHVSQQQFEILFTDPDWAGLYKLAGMEDGVYEGRDAYAAYMQEKAGGKPLTYRQVTFDEAGALSYDVFLGEEKIASFTMENQGSTAREPDWMLGKVSLFCTPDKTFTISVPEGCKVQVNGVELDDSHVIRETYVESLDEKKIRIPGTRVLEVGKLLVTPEVTVTDAGGKQVKVNYDEGKQLFSVEADPGASLGETEKQIALDALKNYCKFMINKGGGQANLQKYFKEGTDTYKAIVGSDLTWVQKEKSHATANEKVTDYVRYSDTMFSVRASLTWQLTRPDDSVKESQVDKSMVFEKVGDKWLCTRMTGLDLTRKVDRVRLTFCSGDQVLESQMVDAGTGKLTCPKVSAPAGKEFAGWAVSRTGEDGKAWLQRVLGPEEEGAATVPAGLLPLEPMTLYPVFQDRK